MADIIKYTSAENQFYPTPEWLVSKMLENLDTKLIETVLEPSAGKGDIVKGLYKKFYSKYNYEKINVDCVEIDPHLRAILKDEFSNAHIVNDDFLTYDTYKHYDLIIMNPPFKDGDRHLLKALDMQKNGGSIICLLNAETLKNPYSITRKLLVQKLEEVNANIEYIDNAFAFGERKANVDIALIKIYIPQKAFASDIFDNLQKAQKINEYDFSENTEIEVTDFIKAIINKYNIEVQAGLELIKQYYALAPYITRGFPESKNGTDYFAEKPMLELKISNSNKNFSTNEYVEAVRSKYWKELLNSPKIVGKLTYDMQNEYRSKVYDMANYEFNEYNIRSVITDINAQIFTGIENEIDKLFDELTSEHSWYPESNKNIHYYNGWKTNTAHKIGKKVILPCHGIWKKNYFSVYHIDRNAAISKLSEIEKILNYVNGSVMDDINIKDIIYSNFAYEDSENVKNIECKYFTVTFYKKGTAHITFTCSDLIDRFNILVGKKRNWLPPYYGKAEYSDLGDEDKKIVDSFQGAESYSKIFKNQEYFLSNNTNNTVLLQ